MSPKTTPMLPSVKAQKLVVVAEASLVASAGVSVTAMVSRERSRVILIRGYRPQAKARQSHDHSIAAGIGLHASGNFPVK
ncbi:MAG: hypothetical protein JSS22_11960 [Proteobacteria bacterium]|nr:hypothetical protein [Pseudomonadota bacterium]